MNGSKTKGKLVEGIFTPAHIDRLQAMATRLHALPGNESSLSSIEVYFYELLTIMKEYTGADGRNPYLEDLQQIREKEYERCRDRFVRITSRNKAVHLFKNRLEHTISGWLYH